jgi:GGDEF domain-containing protein
MISIKSYLERLSRPDASRTEKVDDNVAVPAAATAADGVADKAADSADKIDGADGDRSPALLQALRIVLAGLPLESEDRAKGRSLIDGLLSRLDGALQSFEVLEIADEALAAIEEDVAKARDHRRSDNEQLRAMISMLTETVASISVQKDSSVGQLKQIEQRIENASILEDMRALKASLSTCLATVREASREQQLQSAISIQRMEGQIRSSQAHLSNQSQPAAAEWDSDLVLSDEPEPRETSYAAIFLLDRADLISKRYGESLRNEVIAFVRGHFKKMLMPKDRFIRWNGAAFVVLLQRRGTVEDVSAELRSVSSLGRSQYFDVGGRSIMLDTSLTWTVFPQTDFASPDLFFKAVDGFIKQTAAERKPSMLKAVSHVQPPRNDD